MPSSETDDPSSHYFDRVPSTPSARQEVELVLPDTFLRLTTDTGVFSQHGIDAGTRYLLQNTPELPAADGRVLDLGCGYGPIALTVAARAPGAEVWAVDVNARAVELTRLNADRNGLVNVTACSPDEVPDDLLFDLLVSNPPIRIGKAALRELLTRWLGRLLPTGLGRLVVQKHLGSDSLARWLDGSGFATTRVGSRRGYRILDVRPR